MAINKNNMAKEEQVDRSPENEYNQEPVFYCKSCLSLAVKELEEDSVDICIDCGRADIGVTDIFTWERLVESNNKKNEE